MRKSPFLLIITIIFALSVGWSCSRHNNNSKNQRTATVTLGDIEEVVTAQGKLEPKNYVDVGMQVSGQITQLHVNIGDRVTKGQLLAEIDPRIYQSRLEADEAQLRSLQAQKEEQQAAVELAEQQRTRNQQLFNEHIISQDSYAQSQATAKGSRAKLKSLQAQIDQVLSSLKADRANLGYAKIYAPMAGIVASLPVRAGQTLNAVQSAPTMMRIADFSVMTLRAQVAEADISRIKADMPVYFTTLGDLERRFHGLVRLIQPSPEIINDVVLFNVLIDVNNSDGRLMDGMTTQLFFVLGEAKQVPILPREALGQRRAKQDKKPYKAYEVKMNKDGDIHSVVVHVGLTNRISAQIVKGLKINDQVIIPQQEQPRKQKKDQGLPRSARGPSL